VPRLVFEELKRRNASLHVADSTMPAGLLPLAGSEPLSAREPVPEEATVRDPAAAHAHHHHVEPEAAAR
jgi:hypothetical protein